MLELGTIAIAMAILTSLLIAVWQFFSFPRDMWNIRLGKNFGVLAVFLAIYIFLCDRLAPSGIWTFIMLVPLFFAGLSGFLKNTILSTVATVIVTIGYLLLNNSLFSPPEYPPPPAPPLPPPFDTAIMPPEQIILHPTTTVISPLILGGIYLFAIAGILWSVIQNRYQRYNKKGV